LESVGGFPLGFQGFFGLENFVTNMTKTQFADKQLTLATWKKELEKIRLNMILESMKADVVVQRIKELEAEIEG
jgi:hypothetical protein